MLFVVYSEKYRPNVPKPCKQALFMGRLAYLGRLFYSFIQYNLIPHPSATAQK